MHGFAYAMDITPELHYAPHPSVDYPWRASSGMHHALGRTSSKAIAELCNYVAAIRHANKEIKSVVYDPNAIDKPRDSL